MNQKKLQVWLPLLLAMAVLLGMAFGYKLRDNMGAYAPSFFSKKQSTPFQEVIELIKTKYVDTPNLDSINQLGIQSVINRLDPHSNYFPANEVQRINNELKGSFEGVGIEFAIINDTITVLNLMDNGPAKAAGVEPGDKILKANEITVSGAKITHDKIRQIFRGPKGKEVKVMLLRKGKHHELKIKRAYISIKSIDIAYIIQPGVGFIRLNTFSAHAYEDFMQNMERLQKEGMKKLILDLRNNGGGMLDDAIQIADEFLSDNKEIVFTEGRESTKQTYTGRRPGLFEDGRLIVLIDEGTASAAEVLSGALQDWDRATIIGRRSFGKGLVQEQFQLSDGSAMRLTVSRYYTPVGRSIQKPYKPGERDSYKNEIMNRFNNGELFRYDTSTFTGKVYKTKGGRIVYGNGGISPDLFVPIDSSEFLLFQNHEAIKEFIEAVSFSYYESHQSKIKTATNMMQLQTMLLNDASLWQLFVASAAKHDLRIENSGSAYQQLLRNYLYGMIARYAWGSEGYFKFTNMHDRFVLRALEEIKN